MMLLSRQGGLSYFVVEFEVEGSYIENYFSTLLSLQITCGAMFHCLASFQILIITMYHNSPVQK